MNYHSSMRLPHLFTSQMYLFKNAMKSQLFRVEVDSLYETTKANCGDNLWRLPNFSVSITNVELHSPYRHIFKTPFL